MKNFDFSNRVPKKAKSSISTTSEIDILMMKINDAYDKSAKVIAEYIKSNDVSSNDVMNVIDDFIKKYDEHTQLEIVKRIIAYLI